MVHSTQCCGLKELHGISGYVTPKGALVAIYRSAKAYAIHYDRQFPWWRYFIFTEAMPQGVDQPRRYGEELADFITANNLGEVVRTSGNVNPNSNNVLTIYVWAFDWDALGSWYKETVKPEGSDGQAVQI